MAKVRRIVRKVAEPRGDYFDEKVWPVYIALVVLGAFLMGVSAAYLKFSGVPWYAHAITSLVGIPLIVLGFMIAFRYIDNRLVRRSMQLAVIVSAILHMAMIVHMIETRIFSGFDDEVVAEREVIEPRKSRLMPVYQPQQMLPEEDRPKQDFEKPLEVRTPEPQPEPENIVRQETQPETTRAPEQPLPTPQPVVSTEPNVVKRNQPSEVAPRAAEQPSKLSRQSKPSELKISQLVQSLPIEQPRPAGIEAKAAAARIERQTAELAAKPAAMETPATPAAAPSPQLARKTDAPSPTVDAAAAPTLKRQVAQPAHTPTSPIAAADAPPQPKATSPEALAPASTFTQRQSTASPQVTRSDAPLPEIASTANAPLVRRQAPAETAPQVAQSPAPAPNRQPRLTTRPDVAATAAVPAPTATNPSATAASQLAPQSSRVERATAAVSSSQARAIASAEPTASQTAVAAARPTRTEGATSPSPVASPAATATLTRKRGTPSITAATVAEPAPTGTVTSSATTELAAASTATRRQPTASPQASPTAGEAEAMQLAALNPQAAANNSALRRATGTPSEVPTTGPAGPSTPSQSRSATTAVANVVTRAAEVPTNAGPQAASSSLPGPSSTAVARQASGSAASAATPAAVASPDAGAVAMASGAIARAQSSQVPTMRPQVLAGNSPARATAENPTPTSPTAIDSPAASVATTGAPAMPQPARLAVSRAESGTAGVGRSPNIDRAMPGSESPALVASGAARRAEATTQTPGDALVPSSAAQIARSVAGEPQPTATVRAESAAGNVPGATQVADVQASASAALTRADAQATRAAVTGAKGTTDVDIGPTQVVAERGGTRAAGGGQSEPSTELTAAQITRATPGGGLPQVALAAPQAENVAAPAGESGGVPAAMEAQVAGVARSAPTTPATATGGPQSAEAADAASAATAAQLVAQAELSRAQASDGAAGGGTAGLADAEDEEEKARRLARAAQGGAPQLAISGPVMADKVASPQGDGGDAGAARIPEATAVATTASRMTASGGAPAGGAAAPVADAGAPAGAGGAAAASVAIARAEAADGVPGTPLVGGGTDSPAKASSAPTFAANTTADTIQLAGAPSSSGTADGVPLAARGTQTERMTGGASGPVSSDPQGAVAGDEALLATTGVAPARGQRQSAGGAAEGPQVADAAATTALARAATAAGPSSSAVVSDIPEIGAGSAVAQAELDHMMGGMANTPMTRQSGEAIAVAAAAPEGPGGLGTEYSPKVGINSRKAREESASVQTATTRFVRTSVGGLPSVSTAAVVSREPFVKRSARLDGDQPGSGRGTTSPQTNAAIEAGLAFLARHQHPDGHWSLQGFDDATNAVSADERRFMLVSDTGATALAILAFQGWGKNHREGEYRDVLHRGINHLLAYQKASGDLFVPADDRSNQSVWLYSHALATLALCEAYGMTGDPDLKEPAQRAIDFIVATQNRDLGGWRYSPEYDASGAIIGGVGTDTSVTGWMVAALYSARGAELAVPSEAFARIEKWMNSAQGAGGESHLYRYNPYAPDTAQQRHGRVPSKTMTAVGLLSRSLLGWKTDHPALGRGAEFLQANRPALGTAREPLRDTYYWYYATLALVYLKEGDPARYEPVWQQWEATLHPILRNTQEKQGPWAGSWNPRGPVPDRWGLHAGRLYVTTMNLLSLEADYRHLPFHAAVQGQARETQVPGSGARGASIGERGASIGERGASAP